MYMDKKGAEQLADQVVRLEGYAKTFTRFLRRQFKRILGIAVVATLLLYATEAVAEECKEPQAVSTPCSGVLLPPSAAELGLKCLKVQVPKLKLDIDYLTAERASFEKMHLAMLDAERKRSKALEEQIEFLLKSNVEPRWYEHPAFHFAMGFVTASAVTIGITYAVNSD